MGSSSAFYLSKLNLNILLIDQFEFQHNKGSSHGDSRIIRKSYIQQHFASLMKESYSLWGEIEESYQKKFIFKTGGLDIAEEGSQDIKSVISACKQENIHHEIYTNREIKKKFPAFTLPDSHIGVFQPEAGIVKASFALSFFQNKALNNGLKTKTNEKVLKISYGVDYVVVSTDSNEYKTKKLVIAPGPWINEFFKFLDIKRRIAIYHVGYSFFKVKDEVLFQKEKFPIFINYGPKIFYGFPIFEKASHIKVAPHFSLNISEDKRIFSTVDQELLNQTKDFVSKNLNYVEPNPRDAQSCFYSMTPNEDFIIDFHPDTKDIVFVGGFSGHGFKFAPLIGRVVKDLVMKEKTNYSISKFKL